MKLVLKGLIGLIATLVVIIVAGAYLIPEVSVVERQIVIKAPPEKVFAVAGDLRRFNQWSPWAIIDPSTSYSFEGPPMGVGQKMIWQSADPAVGKGTQTVVEYIENSKLVTDLDFGSLGKARASLLLVPVGGGTGVTWGFRAEASGVLDRWASLMFDKWIGADYERGLERLKVLAEAQPPDGVFDPHPALTPE